MGATTHRAKAWNPALPAVIWQGHLLTPVSPAQVDLSESPLNAVLPLCYPAPNLLVIAELIWQMPDFAEPIATTYGLRWNENLSRTLAVLAETPLEFQNWVAEKKCAARELQPLLALQDVASFASGFRSLAAAGFTRAEGAQALELAVDLFLLGHSAEQFLRPDLAGTALLTHLRKLRRPMETEDRDYRQGVLKKWPWPAHCEGRWLEGHDLPELEIRLRATSASDLQRKLMALGRLSEAWEENSL